MNKKTKTILWVVLFVVFIGLAYFAYNALSEQYKPQSGLDVASSGSVASSGQSFSEKPKIPAPDFTVLDAEGKEVTLAAFKGKPIVINFWATWCGYCKDEMPYFQTAYDSSKGEVAFLMIDAVDGQRETVDKGKAYIEENQYTFPVYFDTKQDALMNYGVTAFPSTLFIDRDGNVVAAQQGAISEKELLAGIQAITAK